MRTFAIFILSLSFYFSGQKTRAQSENSEGEKSVSAAEAMSAEAPVEVVVEKPKFKEAPLRMPSSEELTKQPLFWVCKSVQAVRTLRLEVQTGSCKTTYARDGVDKQVSQSSTLSTCANVFSSIKKNLEASGWKCRDVGASRISSID
jgi:hypothetical protein